MKPTMYLLRGQNEHFVNTKTVHTITKFVKRVNCTKVSSQLNDKLHTMYKVHSTKFGAPNFLTY
jgi:hypothetical protein